MEAGPGTPRNHSPSQSGEGLPTTPISASLAHLQQAIQSLSSPSRSAAASGVEAGLLSSELVRTFSQQLRQGSGSLAGSGQHAAPGQVSSILRQLSNVAQPAATTVTAAPSSDPTPSSEAQQQHDDTPAAAAERHRLGNSQTLDLQAIARWLEGLLPYAFILAAIFVYHFCTGIFLFVWLLCSLVKANQLMRKVIAQKRDYQATEVAAAISYIATNVGVVVWLTSGQRLYRSFLLQPPVLPLTAWQAAFLILIADSLVRFCSLAPKLLVVAAMQWHSGRASSSSSGSSSGSSKGLRHQARLLTLVEYLTAGYRALVPIPIWYTYLLTCTVNNVLCSLLAGFYLTFKGYALLQQGQLVYVAAKLVLRTGASYGKYLSKAEAANICCPVCQEPAATAVKLGCQHVFCDDCITEWLERDKEKTCPMCRASVGGARLKSFGDGATSLLPQLF